jgi:hypothetical protein
MIYINMNVFNRQDIFWVWTDVVNTNRQDQQYVDVGFCSLK